MTNPSSDKCRARMDHPFLVGFAEALRENGFTTVRFNFPYVEAGRRMPGPAAHAILTRPSRECTGNFFIDDEVLRAEGVTNLDQYAVKPGAELILDFFID